MENTTPWQSPSPVELPKRIRTLLAGQALADDHGAIRIVAAMAQSWPQLAAMSIGEVALGDDGLIRFALWSASTCCATLLGTRRATLLLPEGDGTWGGIWEVRCLVIAHASLTTSRPLSGFLLKPVELFNARSARRSPQDIQNRADECRLALFDAFPVDCDGGKHAA